MAVERKVLDPDTRRARTVVRVTFGRDEPLGAAEIEALNEGSVEKGASRLEQQMELVGEFMAQRSWPQRCGRYWANADASRWEAETVKPDWATKLIKHPAQCYPERSAERDAFEILLRCEMLTDIVRRRAPPEEIAERAIDLGMLIGRNNFEAQFGRACDIGIGRILSGSKGGKAYANTTEFLRDRRLGALQRAIDANPSAGPSEWTRKVSGLWPDSADKKAAVAAALRFYQRHKDKFRHEILMS